MMDASHSPDTNEGLKLDRELAHAPIDRRSTGELLALSDNQSGRITGLCQFGAFAAVTDLGSGYKYSDNQDSVFKVDCADSRTVIGIADGMGGYGGGALASHVVVRSVAQDVTEGRSLVEAGDRARLALYYVFETMEQRGENTIGLMHMGATFVGCEITANASTFVHAGDARGILLRRGAVAHATRDHADIQELIERGEVNEDYRAWHYLNYRVRQAIGLEGGAPAPLSLESVTIPLEPGDLVILGSDGLWDVMSAARVAARIGSESDVETIVTSLRQAVRERQVELMAELIRRIREDGGNEEEAKSIDDNVTILAYRHS